MCGSSPHMLIVLRHFTIHAKIVTICSSHQFLPTFAKSALKINELNISLHKALFPKWASKSSYYCAISSGDKFCLCIPSDAKQIWILFNIHWVTKKATHCSGLNHRTKGEINNVSTSLMYFFLFCWFLLFSFDSLIGPKEWMSALKEY